MNLEKSYDRFYKKITIGASLVCFIFFGLAAVEENYLREWKTYQKEFKEILLSKAENETQRQLAEEFPVKIKQIILKDFGLVDRCVTCHNGLEDPRMSDQAPPHAPHSGDYIKKHPIEKFGCTVCHGGQDRALAIKNVFAKEEDVHWENPVLPLEFVQSSCGKCHLAVFDRTQTLPGAEVLMKGREVFYREGCLGCHNVRGTGGATGLELTDEGSKTKQEYSFANIENEHHTVENWLLEHFRNPQKVSGVSEMPPVDLPSDEMDALITFVMGLHTPTFPSGYYGIDLIKEFKGDRPTYSGKAAYEQFCSVCHGKNGEGKNYRVFKASVPRLNNQDFLAVASDAMIRYTVEHGRSGRIMSAWSEPIGGLSAAEISGLTNYIKSWQAQAPTFLAVKGSRADVRFGETIFRSRCGVCHGLAGEGGIGPALNNQDFLALASDEFLYKTIVTGRENTAMRSWAQLSGKGIASLIAFLRSWQTVPSIRLSSSRISGEVENGETLFKTMCVGCHGKYGQGSVGPAVLNRDFLAAASDEFILNSISRGRGNSAMRSWAKEFQGLSQLTQQEMGDIVAYIRSHENKEPVAIHTSVTPGTPANGQILYKGMCSGCHGVNGEGKHGPALNNQEFLAAATDGFLQATIALGRSGTAMRSWAKGAQGYQELSAEQINDIVTYIRTWQRVVAGYE